MKDSTTIKTVTPEQISELIESRINGNISDFNKQVRELTHLQLFDLMEHWKGYYGEKPHMIIRYLRNAFTD